MAHRRESFEVRGPVRLTVENVVGDVHVLADDSGTASVDLDGPSDAALREVEVRGREDALSVIVRRGRRGLAGLFRIEEGIDATVSVPEGSDVTVKVAHGDVAVGGDVGGVHLTTGSGDARVSSCAGGTIATGAGDVEVGATSAGLRVASGSGDVTVRDASGDLDVTSGSGDCSVGDARGRIALRSGSGDIHARRSGVEFRGKSGAGDVHLDRLEAGSADATTAAGDIAIGVRHGVPVWMQYHTVTGSVDNRLRGAGRPSEGQDHLSVRATSVTGDIRLTEF